MSNNNFKRRIQTTLRHGLRQLGQRFPLLQRYSGKLGLGRMLARGVTCEQIRVDDNVIIELDLRVPQFRQYYFIDNQSAAVETILIKHLIRSTDTFVDVGAHIGYFTLVAAKYAQHVIAFEPSRETFARLQRNIALNPEFAPKITLHNVALSDHSGTAEFHFAHETPGGSSLQPIEFASTDTVLVNLTTLDQALGSQDVAFVKIDVEGAELDVLKGGRELIRRCQPLVLCELFDPWQRRFGRSCKSLLDFFDDCGYRALLVNTSSNSKGGVQAKPLVLDELSQSEINNGFFVPLARNDISSLLKLET